MQKGDYSGNGLVEQADLDLVLGNWGKTYSQLSALWIVHRPLTGVVDQNELDAVLGNWGKTQVFFKADFDRDGDVDNDDLVVQNPWKNVLNSAASIYEGDADGDGDVDECDYQWWRYEVGQRPTPPGQTENCTAFTALLVEEHHCGPEEELAEESLEPITDEPVDTDEFPTMQSGEYPRVFAIAELLWIAQTKWQSGQEREAILIWEAMLRVYGREVLPAPVLALMN